MRELSPLSSERYRAGIADAWAGNLATVDECILWIQLGLQGKAQTNLQWRLQEYLRALRAVHFYAGEAALLGIELEMTE